MGILGISISIGSDLIAAAVPADTTVGGAADVLLKEDSDGILQENGSYIILDA